MAYAAIHRNSSANFSHAGSFAPIKMKKGTLESHIRNAETFNYTDKIYLATIDVNQQQNSQERVTAVVVKYLLKTDNRAMAKKALKKKTVALVDLRGETPCLIVHQDKYFEIDKQRKLIMPEKLIGLLKVLRESNDPKKEKCPYRKLIISEGFTYAGMHAATYELLVDCLFDGQEKANLTLNEA